MPPILTFQSVLDATVSTAAVLGALYAHLPPNGSEIVLFDVNRAGRFGPLLRPSAVQAIERILPPLPQTSRVVAIENDPEVPGQVRERSYEPGATTPRFRPLSYGFPAELFSLSHVALPFPLDDPLYGLHPASEESFGIELGTVIGRGERGALVVSLETLQRATSNPFFPYLLERIAAGLADPKPAPWAGGAIQEAGRRTVPAGPQPLSDRSALEGNSP
jgi:hypothetical protein